MESPPNKVLNPTPETFALFHAASAARVSYSLGLKMINVITIVLVVFFLVSAVRVTSEAGKERDIFSEFGQSNRFRVLVWLYPIGPIVILLSAPLVGFVVAFVLGVGCYLPAMLTARKCIASLDRAGTCRVRGAQEAAGKAFGSGVAGLIYATAVLVINTGVWVYAQEA